MKYLHGEPCLIPKYANICPIILLKMLLKYLKFNNSQNVRNRFFSFTSSKLTNTKWVDRNPILIEAGQDIYENRPYLIKPDELTPGITAMEYFVRRNKLLSLLPEKSCAIVVGSQIKYASGSVFYPFQQNNDLYYLTGWKEPDSVMILEKPSNNISEAIFHMIVPPKDPFIELWEGFRSGCDGVCEIFNADKATETSRMPEYISKILKRCDNLYFDIPAFEKKNTGTKLFSDFFGYSQSSVQKTNIMKLIDQRGGKLRVRDLKNIISDLRSIKSLAEIKVMRRTGQISSRAYNQAYARRFRNERTLHSFLEHQFISGGCEKIAYIPVVGAGANALCIHYTKNSDVMYDDELVLVDAAGSIGGYCTDISRTWPVSGKFTEAQKDLYEVVLAVQKRCIDLCTTNQGYSLHDIHIKSVDFMQEELANLGLESLKNLNVKNIYPHYIGHNIGLDVHDVPDLQSNLPLKEGQVITIEPGLYIPNDSIYPKYFRNIGIRIEDNIVIGKDSYMNLTVEASKEVSDIENIAQNGIQTSIEEDVVSPLDFDEIL